MTLIWSLTLLVVTGHVASEYNCPPFNKTGEPRFTTELAQVDYVRLGHARSLNCCAGGVDDIHWFRKEEGTWKTYPSSMNDPYTILSENNQTLAILNTNLKDNTSFKCELIKHGTPVKENVLRLYVLICDKLARGPQLVDPFPVNQTIDKFGINLTFPCTGYFGCADKYSKERFVTWQVKGQWSKDVSEVDSRYSTNTFNSIGGVTLQSNLTIQSVSSVDLKRTFVCQLVSPQVRHGQERKEVRIFKRDVPSWTLAIIVSIASVFGFGLIVMVIGCGIHRLWGPQIRVYCGSRWKIFVPNKIIDGEGLKNNVFVYHADDDTGRAWDIKNRLKDEFNIKISDDLPRNQFELKTIEAEIKVSAMVLFLYSQNLRDDRLANFVIENLIKDTEKSILYITIDDTEPEQAHDRDRNNPVADNDNDIQADGDHGNVNGRKENVVDPKFWNLPHFKYPSENASDRQKNYFWCSLVKKVPKFKTQVEVPPKKAPKIRSKHERGSSSSARPLIETPIPSPALVENPGNGEVRPVAQGQRFSFDGYVEPVCRNGHVDDRYWENFEGNGDEIVRVEVHHSSDGQDQIPGVSWDHQDAVSPDLYGVQQDEPAKRTLSNQSSQSDNAGGGVFLMSQEEPQYQSVFHSTEDETDLNITGRKYVNEQTVARGNENQNKKTKLHVDVDKGNRPHNSCSSPESGYTSMSPERQRDLEHSFDMQHPTTKSTVSHC